MQVICFEDDRVDQLRPITQARPAYAITCASFRLLDWLRRIPGDSHRMRYDPTWKSSRSSTTGSIPGAVCRTMPTECCWSTLACRRRLPCKTRSERSGAGIPLECRDRRRGRFDTGGTVHGVRPACAAIISRGTEDRSGLLEHARTLAPARRRSTCFAGRTTWWPSTCARCRRR